MRPVLGELSKEFTGVGNLPERARTSTAERVGLIKTLPVRSKLSDLLTKATWLAARPEKTDCSCEGQLGFGTAKAVIASRAVTVHASTLLASSQELMARA